MKHIRSPLIFGEVLFDCFPDGREKLGGAPFNVAWNLQAFGMAPVFISRIGDDDYGQRIINEMQLWNMSTRYMQIDPANPTGTVQIHLTDGEPQFKILPEQAYDNIEPPAEKIQQKPAFLYHGSLALRNDVSRRTLTQLKQEHNCPVFIDVNLRKPWWQGDQILTLLEGAAWIKLNEDELDLLFPDTKNLEQRCRKLIEHFKLDSVFVTMGKKGAAGCSRNNDFIRVEPRKNISIMDTVGAGDAFSSVLLLGLMHDWPVDVAMERAQEFASAVVGRRGAITRDKEFYLAFKNKWSNDETS